MFLKKSDPYLLIVGMTGVKMGDRVRADRLRARRTARGRRRRRSACRAAPPSSRPTRRRPRARRKAGENAGVLVEVEVASPTRLPLDDGAFDVAVVDDTAGLFGTMRPEERVAAIRELVRVLRPGGRVLVIGAAPRGGLGARAVASPERSAVRRVGDATSARSRRLQGGAHAGRTRRARLRRGDQAAAKSGLTDDGSSRRVDERAQPVCRRISRDYRAHVRCRPPSIGIVSPVIQPARSDARNRISAAMSSGCPGRPSGCVSFERSRNAAYSASSMPDRR